MSKPDNTQSGSDINVTRKDSLTEVEADRIKDTQAELVEAIIELNNMGDDWDAQHIGELVADWHNKQIAKARIEEVEMFSAGVAPGKYMAPHWYAEDRIKELSQTLKELEEEL